MFEVKNDFGNQNNDYLINEINHSIIIKDHEHPLKLCYTYERRFYGDTWTCNKCLNKISYDIPSFYCSFCDYDICKNCIGNYKLNEIKIHILIQILFLIFKKVQIFFLIFKKVQILNINGKKNILFIIIY